MADIPGVPLNERGAPTEVFGELTIERRVLLTPGRTISIPNIASVSVDTFVTRRPPGPLYGALACVAWALNSTTQSGSLFSSTGMLWPFGLMGAVILLVIWTLSKQYSEPFLIVASSDGTRTLFKGNSHETLEKVRRVLSDKINAHDETSTYTINFANGTIESLNVASVDSLQAGAIVQGDNNQVIAGSPQARLGTHETTYNTTNATTHNSDHSTTHATTLSHSPAAQVGTGHIQHGTQVHMVHVDYAGVLPQVEALVRHYAGRPETRHIEERLSELEMLMRAGTPTPQQKSRLRDLVGEITAFMQAAPQWVEFFRSIARMAGF